MSWHKTLRVKTESDSDISDNFNVSYTGTITATLVADNYVELHVDWNGTTNLIAISGGYGTSTGSFVKNLVDPKELVVMCDIVSPGYTHVTLTFEMDIDAPTITSAATAEGKVGESFLYQIEATNMEGVTSGMVSSGPYSMDPSEGLSCNASTGEITGTPSGSGTKTITVYARNPTGVASKEITITITSDKPVITSPGEASAIVGTPFSYQITASNMQNPQEPPYGMSGSHNLTVDHNSGVVSGTPTRIGTITITVYARNEAGVGERDVVITVSRKPPSGPTNGPGGPISRDGQRVFIDDGPDAPDEPEDECELSPDKVEFKGPYGGNENGTLKQPDFDPVMLIIPEGKDWSNISDKDWDWYNQNGRPVPITLDVYCEWMYNAKVLRHDYKFKYIGRSCKWENYDSTILVASKYKDGIPFLDLIGDAAFSDSEGGKSSNYTEFRKFPVPEMEFEKLEGEEIFTVRNREVRVFKDTNTWSKGFNRNWAAIGHDVFDFVIYRGQPYCVATYAGYQMFANEQTGPMNLNVDSYNISCDKTSVTVSVSKSTDYPATATRKAYSTTRSVRFEYQITETYY